MNTARKAAVIASLITAGLLTSGTVFAQGHRFHHGQYEYAGRWVNQQREYSKDEVAILMQARILKRGNPNLTLGKVTETKEGFEATIVTKKEGALVNTIALDKYARPTDGSMGHHKMKKRMYNNHKRLCAEGNMAMDSDGQPMQRKPHHRAWVKRVNSDTPLTKEQIETLMEARLIRRGNPNVKLGEVQEVGENFAVTIVTQDNALVRELTLNPTGWPVKRN